MWAARATELTGKEWRYVKVLQTNFNSLQPTTFEDCAHFGTLQPSLFDDDMYG